MFLHIDWALDMKSARKFSGQNCGQKRFQSSQIFLGSEKNLVSWRDFSEFEQIFEDEIKIFRIISGFFLVGPFFSVSGEFIRILGVFISGG